MRLDPVARVLLTGILGGSIRKNPIFLLSSKYVKGQCMFNPILHFMAKDLAIDLGTANTLVYVKGKGIIADEPSVVAVHRDSRGAKKVIAVGNDAKNMLGKTPGNIDAIRPLRDGVIADFEITEAMLKYFIQKANGRKSRARPRIVISVPSCITPVEKRAVKESAESGGAKEVYLIEQPMAAAIGAGLPITEPNGSMIVDIGGGTTEVAVISLAGIVYCNSVKAAGDKIDLAIIQYIKRKHNLLIGERTAEMIKINLGSAYPDPDEERITMEIKGRDLVGGTPNTLEVSSAEIRQAISDPVKAIVEAIRIALERTPPELAGDIVDKGIVMSGGGAMLKNIDVLIKETSRLPVSVAGNPTTAVCEGAGKALDEVKLLREIASYI